MIGPVIEQVVQKLDALQRTQTGHIHQVWEALQLELTLEKLFWGTIKTFGVTRAAYVLLRQYAVNLGPGHNVPSRSKTDEKGCITLTHWRESINTPDMLPSFSIWTTHHVQVGATLANILKIFRN